MGVGIELDTENSIRKYQICKPVAPQQNRNRRLLLRFFYSHCFTKTGLGKRSERALSLLWIPSFKEIAVLVNDGSKLGDFRADFDTIVTKTCTFM